MREEIEKILKKYQFVQWTKDGDLNLQAREVKALLQLFNKKEEGIALDNEDRRRTIYRDGFDAGYIGACKDCVNITGCEECKSEIEQKK